MLPDLAAIGTSDIPKLWVVLAEWLACLTMVTAFPKRRSPRRVAVVSVLTFVLIAVIQYGMLVQQDTGEITWRWFSLMGLSVAVMGLGVYASCDMGAKVAAFWTFRALGMAEFTASLAWELTFYLFRDDEPDPRMVAGLLLICYGLLFGGFRLLEGNLAERLDAGSFSLDWRELAVSVVISLFMFLLSNMRLVTAANPFSGSTLSESFNVRTLASLGGLICLYTHLFQLAEAHTRRRLETVNQVLVAQYAQYRQSKENIDIINRKYHDLKQQIAVLRLENDDDKRQRYLDGMERSLKEYAARIVTGNGVLDTVLTGKSLTCSHRDITMTCVADGSLFDGIDAMDLCTIVGNALDNAIEAEERVEDPSRRLISISLSRLNDFAVFKVENYAPEEPLFQEGIPVTSKADRSNHGFGMASMRHCARKYGGDMTASWKEDWFTLQVLIPLRQRNEGD